MNEIPPSSPRPRYIGAIVVAVTIGLFVALHLALDTRVKQWELRALGAEQREAELQNRLREIEAREKEMEKSLAAQTAEFSARAAELAQREAAIAGREDAASQRTESSFQGLMIQQRLTKNLEELKASLPDMTPEIEKLTREHAQWGVENERLRKELSELRQGRAQ